MCTLAWGTDGGGLWVCFNRDEQRSRTPAELPAFHQGPSGPLAFCRDPAGGGTWFAVSSCGFAVALLNHYPAGGGPALPGPESRGRLVTRLAEQEHAAQARTLMESLDLTRYGPFKLFLLSTDAAAGFAWEGELRSLPDGVEGFVTTSSFRPKTVCEWRRRQWRNWTVDRKLDLPLAARLLRERHPGEPSLGFTMDREDARTLSQVGLLLGRDRFRFSCRERERDGPGFDPPFILEYPGPHS